MNPEKNETNQEQMPEPEPVEVEAPELQMVFESYSRDDDNDKFDIEEN